MIWWELFFEFFQAGLFAVGGGLATLPFLYDIARRYDWLPIEMMPDMIAISESTPGPIGVNMATYAGFNAAGVLGGLWATFALVLPSFIVIIAVARFLNRFSENKKVKAVFTALRPAMAGLIAAVFWQVLGATVLDFEAAAVKPALFTLFVVLSVMIFKFKRHPLFYIAAAAVAGTVFKL